MTILNNHIYNNIIYIILKYLYPKNELSGYTTSNHKVLATIELATVSKKWFQYVSSNLTDRILNFNNYETFLNCFINVDYETKSDETYQLIKTHGSVKVYYTLIDYENDKETQDKYQFRKILVNVDDIENKELLKFLLSRKQYPSNVYFDLSINEDSSVYTYEFSEYQFDELVSKKRINKVEIKGHKLEYQDQHFYNTLIRLNPKSIVYYPNYKLAILPYRPRLYYILNNISNLKYFYLRSSDVQLSDIANLNSSKSNLKSLDVSLRFHNYIGYLNGDQQFINYEEQSVSNSTSNPIESEQQLINQWNLAIQNLCNLKSLKHLLISSGDYEGDTSQFSNEQLEQFIHNSNNKPNIITLGIKSLLSNPKSNIHTLQLTLFDFIDQNIIDGLKSNKSISTLILDCTESSEVIKQVLPVNKSIRNLYCFDEDNTADPIDYLKLFLDENIRLHSVRFCNDRFNHSQLLEILQFLNQYNFNINEFYFRIDKEYRHLFKSQFIINNSIININKYL